MQWNPIVDNDKRKQYEDIIVKIRKSIIEFTYTIDMKSLDLMYGYSGFVLLFTYLHKYKNDEPDLERMIEIAIVKFINGEHNDFTLGTGVNGPKWLFQHQMNEGILDLDSDDLFNSVEVENVLEKLLKDGNYDYLVGGLSELLFKISVKDKSRIKELIEILFDQAKSFDGVELWEFYNTIDGVDPNTTVFNLGIAHGIPGIIIILGLASDYCDDFKLKIENGITYLLNWLLSFRIREGTSLYPEFIEYPYKENKNTSYLRWCYGDMGIAFSFFLSGKKFNNENWKDEGIQIMLNCVERLDSEIDEILEAHICHGTAGLGHMFNRFYQFTGINQFKAAAVKCFDKTIEKAHADKNGNAKFYALKGEFGKVPFGGLMEGASGIALTLLAAISDVEPKWDRLFLLS